MTSIRSPRDTEQNEVDARIIARTNAILNIGFVQEMTAQERSQVIDEYRRILRSNPLWVIDRAFDAAAREIPHRPTPREISLIADRLKRPIAEEIARRQKAEADMANAKAEADRNRVSPAAAARILAEFDMTPERLAAVRMRPMSSDVDADSRADAEKPLTDWTNGLGDTDPRLVALRRSRAESMAFNKMTPAEHADWAVNRGAGQ